MICTKACLTRYFSRSRARSCSLSPSLTVGKHFLSFARSFARSLSRSFALYLSLALPPSRSLSLSPSLSLSFFFSLSLAHSLARSLARFLGWHHGIGLWWVAGGARHEGNHTTAFSWVLSLSNCCFVGTLARECPRESDRSRSRLLDERASESAHETNERASESAH